MKGLFGGLCLQAMQQGGPSNGYGIEVPRA